MQIVESGIMDGLTYVIATYADEFQYLVGTPNGDPYVSVDKIAHGSYGAAASVEEARANVEKFAFRFSGWAVMLHLIGGLPDDLVSALKSVGNVSST